MYVYMYVCVCARMRTCMRNSPLGHAHAVWLVADLRGLVSQVVLVDVDAQGDVLVLKVSLHLLTGLLQQAQLLERLAYSLLQRLLDAVNHLHLLHARREEKIALKKYTDHDAFHFTGRGSCSNPQLSTEGTTSIHTRLYANTCTP